MKSKIKFITNNTTTLQKHFTEVTLNLKSDKAQTRYDILEGNRVLVIPCVMITEGVHEGSQGPLYYPAEELSKNPGAWNGRPVVVYHPTMHGLSTSANDPDIFKIQRIGQLFNTKWEDGKLKTECWIDEEKANKIDDRVLKAIENGDMIEVSTGLFTDHDDTEGIWNGKAYQSIARNYHPDHLAILPDLKGACSIEDGAGLLRNEKNAQELGTPESFQVLGKSIIILTRGEGQGKGGAKQGDGGTDTCVCPECGVTVEHKRGTPCADIKCSKCGSKMIGSGAVKNAMQAFQKVIKNEMSHNKIWEELNNRIQSSAGKEAWISDVYPTFFVYEINSRMFYQKYETNDKEIKLIGVRQKVEKIIQYQMGDGLLVGNKEIIVNNSFNKESVMDKEKVVNALIANEKSPWTEDEREFLMALSDEKLVAWAANTEEKEKESAGVKVESGIESKAKVENKVEMKVEPTDNEEVTLEQYIADAPAKLQDPLQSLLSNHKAQKDELMVKITANERNTFSPEQLEAFGLNELKQLAQLAEVPMTPIQPNIPAATFGGKAEVIQVNANQNEEEPLVAPVMNFQEEK